MPVGTKTASIPKRSPSIFRCVYVFFLDSLIDDFGRADDDGQKGNPHVETPTIEPSNQRCSFEGLAVVFANESALSWPLVNKVWLYALAGFGQDIPLIDDNFNDFAWLMNFWAPLGFNFADDQARILVFYSYKQKVLGLFCNISAFFSVSEYLRISRNLMEP